MLSSQPILNIQYLITMSVEDRIVFFMCDFFVLKINQKIYISKYKCIYTNHIENTIFYIILVQPWRGIEVFIRRGARAAPQGYPVRRCLQQCYRTDCQGRQTLESGSGKFKTRTEMRFRKQRSIITLVFPQFKIKFRI